MLNNIVFYLLCFLISTGFVTYISFCIRFWFGYKYYQPKVSFKKQRISVIIVSRNEARNLPALFLCLQNQDYPKELFEVILADDDSEDESEQIAMQFMEAGLNLRYMKVLGRDKVISPKKHALGKAIEASIGDIILTTDADCILPITWISSMVSLFTDDVSMVAGYSRTLIPNWDKASILHKYEHLDFALTYMVLAGGYTLGRSWACIGQNLAYRKSAYESVGGFSQIRHLISGDDVNLMQLMRRKGHRIIFNFFPASFVHTHPVKSWKQLVNQRSRWASNMKYQLKFNPEFFFILLTMAFIYWGGIIMMLFNLWLGLIIFGLRILIENIFVSYTRKRFGVSAKMMLFYPIWLVIQTFFLVFTMVLGQFNFFVWHGKRPYKRN
jgi:cellulose synthase/poly-beta-1,6-N-acetylglucosamine synthase-like glycosyltransferase